MDESPRMLNRQEAADFLGVTPQTMLRWDNKGIGPKFYRLGKRIIRYKKSDLMAWLESQSSEGEGELLSA
jgi:excisionase family DNA binding protein